MTKPTHVQGATLVAEQKVARSTRQAHYGSIRKGFLRHSRNAGNNGLKRRDKRSLRDLSGALANTERRAGIATSRKREQHNGDAAHGMSRRKHGLFRRFPPESFFLY